MSLTIRSAQTIRNGVTLQGTAPPPPAPSLPFLFELDASNYISGTVLHDVSGQGHDGLIHGSPSWDSDAGGCFVFNGDPSKYIEVPGSEAGWGLTSTTPNASFSVWTKISGVSWYQHIAGWRGGIDFWFLILSGVPVTEARFGGTVTYYDVNINYSAYFNNWAHVAFTLDVNAGIEILYINGVNVGQTTGLSGNFISTASPFTLGCDYGGAFAMNGKIGGAAAYSRALTEAEVVSEFNRTKTRYGL